MTPPLKTVAMGKNINDIKNKKVMINLPTNIHDKNQQYYFKNSLYNKSMTKQFKYMYS